MTGTYLKRNASTYPDQLLCEAQGLEALRAAAEGTGLDVPQVHSVDAQVLAMTRIDPAGPTPAQWARLGTGLARLHARAQQGFGFESDNYLGRNPQPNGWDAHWGRFFLRRRLEFQVGLVADAARQRQYRARLRAAAQRLVDYLDAACSLPSLLHGDLWSGNVLFDREGRAWLIDPAAYHGDPEADLAMTRLFGGFDAAFYDAYRALRPAPADEPLRRRVYNLYHLLNHYNLFGTAYLAGCEDGWSALEAL